MRLLVPLLALASAVPVFVMMPLDTVSPSGVLKAGLQVKENKKKKEENKQTNPQIRTQEHNN